MCDEILIFFVGGDLICSIHYATASLVSQQFSSIKIPTVQNMDKDTIYQSCMSHSQLLTENRILSNHNSSFIYFTMLLSLILSW